MEVKPGFKQTKVGAIPEDWQIGNLIRFWSVIDCKHLTADFVQSGMAVASISEVQSRFVNLQNSKQTTKFYYKQLIEGGRKPLPGDLIFSRNATIGEVAQVAEWHQPFAMGQDVCLLKKKSADYSTEFLQSVIYSPLVVTQIVNLLVGSTFKRVNVEQIRNLVVPMPPPDEQRAIAEALSNADALIESLEQLIDKKRLIKQGAMQELLTGRKRLPGFYSEKLGYKQTEVGVIPEDWLPTTIGDLATKVGSGITPKGGSNNYKEYGRPFVRSQNVGWGTLLLTDLAYIDEETHNSFSSTELRQDDVLLNITGASIGRSSIVGASLVGGNVNQHVCIIRTHTSEVSSRLINYFLLSRQGQQQIDSFQAGGNREGLNFGQIRSIKLALSPKLSEQTAIATILSDMDAELATLETKLAKARQIKQGMMQELLTGRIRLV